MSRLYESLGKSVYVVLLYRKQLWGGCRPTYHKLLAQPHETLKFAETGPLITRPLLELLLLDHDQWYTDQKKITYAYHIPESIVIDFVDTGQHFLFVGFGPIQAFATRLQTPSFAGIRRG